MKSEVKTLKWCDTSLELIDQRELPFKEQYIRCTDFDQVASAIKDMVVRGAPAIGVTAAYGVALAAIKHEGDDREGLLLRVNEAIDLLSGTRPTAVNLFWALGRMSRVVEENATQKTEDIKKALVREAVNIEKQDLRINMDIGKHSLGLFKDSDKLTILTHCNAGALATSGYGTALAVIRSLNSVSKIKEVYADETRPYLQGARLTAWELYVEDIPFYVITDNMSAYFISEGIIDAVVVGADRIAANGDTANKIGTLGLSIIAKYYSIPFYVAAPTSTIDLKVEQGVDIPIEQRPEKEVREVMGRKILLDEMPVKNPSFDVTPNDNIAAIITEKGLLFPPFEKSIKAIF